MLRFPSCATAYWENGFSARVEHPFRRRPFSPTARSRNRRRVIRPEESPLGWTSASQLLRIPPRAVSGEVAEWSIAAVLKTAGAKAPGGSNPSLSASCALKHDLPLRTSSHRSHQSDERARLPALSVLSDVFRGMKPRVAQQRARQTALRRAAAFFQVADVPYSGARGEISDECRAHTLRRRPTSPTIRLCPRILRRVGRTLAKPFHQNSPPKEPERRQSIGAENKNPSGRNDTILQ